MPQISRPDKAEGRIFDFRFVIEDLTCTETRFRSMRVGWICGRDEGG
jgi:hypothetical protein